MCNLLYCLIRSIHSIQSPELKWFFILQVKPLQNSPCQYVRCTSETLLNQQNSQSTLPQKLATQSEYIEKLFVYSTRSSLLGRILCPSLFEFGQSVKLRSPSFESSSNGSIKQTLPLSRRLIRYGVRGPRSLSSAGPLQSYHSGRCVGSVEQKLYVHHDSIVWEYSDYTVVHGECYRVWRLPQGGIWF
jgi:hypothetical protein